MNIEIVLRTHDKRNIHTDRERYCGMSKSQLIEGCVSSLINSAEQLVGHQIKFTILDDHSSIETIVALEELFGKSKWPYELLHLAESGHHYSGLKQFEKCRDSDADLVYSVEDDYLHCPTALQEMLDSYQIFKEKSGGAEIVLYPFDMPDDYVPPYMQPSFIVHGSERHWRSGIWTTFTMMARPELFRIHWETFEKLATQYEPCGVNEGNTICEIWKNHALRFSPIPSLALHMQFDTQIDPFIDWKYWWEKYSTIKD